MIATAPITVLCVPGTFNPNGEDVTSNFIGGLDGAALKARIVSYVADYGKRYDYRTSVIDGSDKLITAARDLGGRPFFVYGYSQGAQIAGDFAAAVGDGRLRGFDLRGAALLADPSRPRGQSIITGHTGFGISGQRTIARIPTFHAVAFGDPIGDLPDGNRLRDAADLTEFMSLTDPIRWMEKTASKAARGEFQNVALRPWDRDAWQRIGLAAQWARGYLLDGRHDRAYIQEGLCSALAARVNSAARVR